MDAPTLLIPPSNHTWSKWLQRSAPSYVHLPRAVDGDAFIALPHDAGERVFRAQLTIREKDTIVEASPSTTFRIMPMQLRVVFVDGTEREVDARSNVTLRVMVTSPSSQYFLKWHCHPEDQARASCFQNSVPLSSFPTSTFVANMSTRFRHMWHILQEVVQSNDFFGGPPHPPPTMENGVQEEDSEASNSTTGSDPSGKAHLKPNFPFDIWRYIETITFPASTLLTSQNKFVFRVTCTMGTVKVEDKQMIVVTTPRDSIGIVSLMGSQFPFGALRRMVFESKCSSCSPKELAALQYSWDLKVIFRDSSREVIAMTSDLSTMLKLRDWPATPYVKELRILNALRRGRSAAGFLPRPKDYLRVYNKSALVSWPEEEEEEEEEGSGDVSQPYPDHVSTRDLQDLPGPVTEDIIARASEVHRRWVLRLNRRQEQRGGERKRPEGRGKRSVQDVEPENKSSPSPALVSLGSSSPGQIQNLGGRSMGKNNATSQRRLAQNHHAREEHRMSSAQTNKRREVLGRHSGAEGRELGGGGAAMMDEAGPQERSRITSAKVKHLHRHLLHETAEANILSVQYGEVEREEGGLLEAAGGEAGTWPSSPGKDQDPSTGSSLPEAEDPEHQQNFLDASSRARVHDDRVNAIDDGELRVMEGIFAARPEAGDVGTRGAGAHGHTGSRSDEREKRTNEEKDRENVSKLQVDEVIGSGNRENDDDDLGKIKHHEEEEYEDPEMLSAGDPAYGLKLGQLTSVDQEGRVHQLSGGSRRKKWLPMRTESDAGNNEAGAGSEGPEEHQNSAKSLTESQVTERGGSGRDSRWDLHQKTMLEEVRKVTPRASVASGDILAPASGKGSRSSRVDGKTEKMLDGIADFGEAGASRNPVMLLKTSQDGLATTRVGLKESGSHDPGRVQSTPLPGVEDYPTSSSASLLPSSQFPPTPLSSLETASTITPMEVDEEKEFSTTDDCDLGRESEEPEMFVGLQSLLETPVEEARHQVEIETVIGEEAILDVRERNVLKPRITDLREEEHELQKKAGVREITRATEKNTPENDDNHYQTADGDAVTTSSHEEEETDLQENNLTSGARVKVRENDENDVGSVAEAGKVAATRRQSAHQRRDSTFLPIRVAHSGPLADGSSPIRRPDQTAVGGASERPWEAREVKPSGHRSGDIGGRSSTPGHDARGAGGRSSQPEVGPPPFYTPLSLLRGSLYYPPQAAQLPPYALLPVLSPRPPATEVQEYKKLRASRKIASDATSEPNLNVGIKSRKGGWSEVDHLRLAPARSGDRRAPSTSAANRKGSLYRSESISEEVATPWYQMSSAPGVFEGQDDSGGSGALGRGWDASPKGAPPPSARHPYPYTPLTEGTSSTPARDITFQGSLKKYASDKQGIPNFNCRPEKWEMCAENPPNAQINATVIDTVGDPGQGDKLKKIDEVKYDHFVTEKAQVDVMFFKQMTSTGIHGPVLVLYTDFMATGIRYVLYLNTYNPLTNNSGQARQLIKFSPSPKLKNCHIIPLNGKKGLWYRAACDDVQGKYYPILLQWSYRFLWLGAKTVFYHGARTSFDFTLPSGLESNGYKVYVSVKATDGKGVSYKYPEPMNLEIHPISSNVDGVLSIFQEISNLENESPSLLLQQVRTLAWELNLVLSSDITQTVFDNILAIIFYRTSCKDSLKTVHDMPNMNEQNSSFVFAKKDYINYFVEVNLLKSCARDHMAEIVVSLPIRDEMEVLQVLTALQIIVDAPEYISSMTYSRVIAAMHTTAERMWFSYNAEVRTKAAQEYFILSSAVLDKQAEIYDWNTTSIHVSNMVIQLLLNVMAIETKARFLEEELLAWSTNTLTFHGYLAEAENINRCNHSVSFFFEPHSVPHGVHLVQSLVHKQSPYSVTQDPITSEVLNVDLRVSHERLRQVKVKVKRSEILMGPGYDFRRQGVLTPQSLSVYEFAVTDEHRPMTFHVLLQITKVLNSEYPVAAVVLICQNLQSLKDPLYKQELMATVEASEVSLFLPPDTLSLGKKLIIIIDKNSYENNWGRYNTSSEIRGADFLVSAWWSQCLVWDDNQWNTQNCSVISEESSWDLTACRCKSKFSVYGAQSVPILDEESKMDVNELMLHKTYLALYFMMVLLVVYFMLALAMQTSDRHRLRRRNIWLRDNKPEHEWAYLLTIKTGTQWNAGTTSKVYVILHGTHGMSETRELQSKQTGQLFTRGALCTFILTTPEPLGDILKVQVWHDNSGGSESGWYVCETSVADLVLGASYAYPCYRWLSVQAEDAKVEREITLESPTTFLQDFEHFLPQYASEHMLWTSLLTTSNTAKLYRLQRLTICLIVCLCLGTVSLGVVQRINNEHTMMVPDMHIQSVYYGGVIALLLLPVQWLLEMVFKMSNRLEEKEYNAKTVLDTLRATKERVSAASATDEPLSDEENVDSEIFDPNARMWRNLTKWAQSTELSSVDRDIIHPALWSQEDAHVTQRMRSTSSNKSRNPPIGSTLSTNSFEPLPAASFQRNMSNIINNNPETTSTKKCSPTILHFLSQLRKTFTYMLQFLGKSKKLKNKKKAKMEEEGCNPDEDDDDDDDDDTENDELGATSSVFFIFSQCVGWMVCCFFAALCCMVLFVQGSGMPMDYGALWIHIIYVTLCFSIFIMQPLVVVIYTLYKVCMYRWLGCRGCISSCVMVPLDQVVAIWNRYQAVLLGKTYEAEDTNYEKLLEDRQRTRDLRFAHPPSEDYLLKCRETEVRREKVSGLLCNTVGHLLLLILLAIIVCNAKIEECFTLNSTIYSALENGTCLDSVRYLDTCTSSGTNRESCNQEVDEDYMRFQDIRTKDDWWKWAYSELLAFTYNYDENYSLYKIFCDSNSIIVGTPRLRKYDIHSEECEANKYKISNNRSLADLLRVKTCFPDYVDKVSHLFSFGSNINKEYEWDAHFLAVTYGKYSQYSYTDYKQSLANTRFGTILRFMILQGTNWLSENSTRAVVTEFTLYHSQTNLYTTVNLLAEFPSLSGAEVKTYIESSHIERYRGRRAYVCMLAEILLLAVSMYYLNHSTIYIYVCRFRVWKSFWGMLDILMTLISWTFMVCLMLRVQIAEDAMWQLRVAYFQKFVNLKGLTTWDNTLEALIGGMLMVHLLRCLRLTRYLPRLRRLGLVMASAAQDVCIISVLVTIWLICCMLLGYKWFGTVLSEFHTLLETTMTLLKIIMARVPFLPSIENESSGYIACLGYLYYVVTYILLYQVTRALYVAAFMHARKSFIHKPGLDVNWKDISFYIRERYQSLLQKFHQKKEEEIHPKDNTPPDFYVAELELQISQVMGKLENLAETLGLMMDRLDGLEEDQQSVSDISDNTTHQAIAKDLMCSYDCVWQPEEKNRSCSLTELEALLKPMESCKQEIVEEAEHNRSSLSHQVKSFEGRLVNEKLGDQNDHNIPMETSFNLDAFTDIASCQTEIEALTRNWNLNMAMFDQSMKLGACDDGGRLAKFLKDVSAASEESVTSFGKYGKTVGKLKMNSKLHPSYESLATVQNHHGDASETTCLHPVKSSVIKTHVSGLQPQINASPPGQIDCPIQGPEGISSRLCRTQTQGRGKGHVDFLDIVSLELDSEDDSEL